MKPTEILKWVFGVALFIFLFALVFNHLSPWVAILLLATTLYAVAKRFDSLVEKSKEESETDDLDKGDKE